MSWGARLLVRPFTPSRIPRLQSFSRGRVLDDIFRSLANALLSREVIGVQRANMLGNGLHADRLECTDQSTIRAEMCPPVIDQVVHWPVRRVTQAFVEVQVPLSGPATLRGNVALEPFSIGVVIVACVYGRWGTLKNDQLIRELRQLRYGLYCCGACANECNLLAAKTCELGFLGCAASQIIVPSC